jgi:hypothetical protein
MGFEPISIEWHGPYSFVDCEAENIFGHALGSKAGIYLFTIPYNGKFLVYYVGETGASFANRLLQHVQNYLNGFYRVFEPSEFSQGKKVLIWGGMWKANRKDPKLISDFLEQQTVLSPKIVKLIEQFRIFLAPIECNKRLRERVESAIAKSLNEKDGLMGDFQDKDVRYRPIRTSEATLKVTFTNPYPIMGLSDELFV